MTDELTSLTVPKTATFDAIAIQQTGNLSGALLPKSLGEAMAFAQLMAKAKIGLPKHLRDEPGACMAIVMQALRWEMDPFAVANKSYSVNDRLVYESQLIAAVVHTRAPIIGRPAYVYTGEGETRQCTVTCVMADGETRDYVTPPLNKITVRNSPLWKSDLDQQLGYYAIRGWARRHAPEVILGVYDREEVESMRDITPRNAPSGVRERLEMNGHLQSEGFRDGQVDETLARPVDVEVVDVIVETAKPLRRQPKPKVEVVEPEAVGTPVEAPPETREEIVQPDPAIVLGVDLAQPSEPTMVEVTMEDGGVTYVRVIDPDPFVLQAIITSTKGPQTYVEPAFWYGDIINKMNELKGRLLTAFWEANKPYVEAAGANGYATQAGRVLGVARDKGLEV